MSDRVALLKPPSTNFFQKWSSPETPPEGEDTLPTESQRGQYVEPGSLAQATGYQLFPKKVFL
jgi:hypothetical protein